MFNVDELIDAALKESSAKAATEVAAAPPPTEFQKLADILESASKEAGKPVDQDRFNKLAMAVILDTINDPKAKKGLEALTHDIVKNAQIVGGVVNDTPEPGTIGAITENTGVRTKTMRKQKIDTGRTLFSKLQDSVPGPAAETN